MLFFDIIASLLGDYELGQKWNFFLKSRICLNLNGFHKNLEAQADC